MNPMQVRALLHELMDENPFAIRAVLKILSVEFTETVATLAVTNEPQPRLLINLAFINQHCRTEEHVKALLLGLCTAWQYDPSRPVLWTRASLTRRVELYEPAGFYA